MPDPEILGLDFIHGDFKPRFRYNLALLLQPLSISKLINKNEFKFDSLRFCCSKFSWVELERKTDFPALRPGQELNSGDDLPLQGGGFTKQLYLKRFVPSGRLLMMSDVQSSILKIHNQLTIL